MEQGSISSENKEALKEFSSKFVVSKKLVVEYVVHLEDLKLRKYRKTLQREKQKQQEFSLKYEEYNWRELFEPNKLKILNVPSLKKYLAKHNLQVPKTKKAIVEAVIKHLCMPRQTTIKCDKFINNPEEAYLSDESDTSDIDSESDNQDDVLIYSKHDSPDESQVDSEAESDNEDIVDHSSTKEHESVSVLGTETMITSERRVRTPKHLKDYLFAAEREIPRKISVYFLVGKDC